MRKAVMWQVGLMNWETRLAGIPATQKRKHQAVHQEEKKASRPKRKDSPKSNKLAQAVQRLGRKLELDTRGDWPVDILPSADADV